MPIIKHGTRADVVHATIQYTSFWAHTRHFRLTENMRLRSATPENIATARWLMSVGNGEAALFLNPSENNDEDYQIILPHSMILSPNTENNLIADTYTSIPSISGTSRECIIDYYAKRMILTPNNDVVSHYNETIIHSMEGDAVHFYSFDVPIDSENVELPPENLAGIDMPGLPPHHLKLKEGVPLILMRNLNAKNGLCNGTRLLLIRINRHLLECVIMTGNARGQSCLIPRMTLASTRTDASPFLFHRKQFPVKLAFAMTINKSQGQSLDRVGIDLTSSCFTHGQLYVALSRATDHSGTKVLLPEDSHTTQNLVFTEVLQSEDHNTRI